MRTFRSLLVLFGLIALLGSCSDMLPLEPPIGMCTPEAPRTALLPAGVPLDGAFAAAAEEFGVPAELLKAIGYVETRWQMVDGHSHHPGQPAAQGIMALKGEQVERGAALAGVPAAEARTRPEANIRAAAALLRAYADELGFDRADIGAWAPAVARYSGIALPEGRATYVHQDVYGVLRQGVAGSPAGEFSATLAPVAVRADYPIPVLPSTASGTSAASTDHAGALWRASPNFNARPAGDIGKVAMIIIHSCEGSYTGCWSWLANPDSRVSAHYVVNESGSEITQLVREADRGWHIGSQYDCKLNQGWECWRNGQSNNHFTIGIEHAGFASQTAWPRAQIDASARLVCEITRRHGITRDNIRILSHAQLQPHNRSDPGAGWPWAEYYARIDAHCGGSGNGAGEVVIDGGQSGAPSGFSASGNWTLTRLTSGYHGAGYRFASTGAESDPAVFRFHLAEPATRTVEAWWTAGTNRSSAAAFSAFDAQGRRLGTARVNQQTNGSRWNTLGTWSFPAGWNEVRLSRQGLPGCVVIADAVRVR